MSTEQTINIIELVSNAWNQEVDPEFAANVMMSCTCFPFGTVEQIKVQLVEVAFAVDFSTDVSNPIGWATKVLDNEWEASRAEREAYADAGDAALNAMVDNDKYRN